MFKTLRMKKLYYLISLVFLICNLSGYSQTQSVPAELSLAFKTGNVDKIAEYLNSTIELVILDKEDFYSKKVAESILSDFFKSNPVKEFIIKHQGGQDNANFAIGNLKTNNGSFRVYFLIKKVDSKPLIHQLRIEKDDSGSN